MRSWPVRRWLAATAIAVVIMLVIGVPTVLVPTPWFGREIEVTWWSWPVLLATAALSGLLAATYVRADAAAPAAPAAPAPTADDDAGATTSGRLGVAGGLLAYLAVGCPVCNKVALLALGYTGALQWFAPLQPVLAAVAVVLLGWALRRRLAGERACPVALPEPPRRSTVDIER